MLTRKSMIPVLAITLAGCLSFGLFAQDQTTSQKAIDQDQSSVEHFVFVQQDDDDDENNNDRGRRSRRSSRSASRIEKNHQSILDSYSELTSGISKTTVKCLVDEDTVCRGTIVDPSGLVIIKSSSIPADKEFRCELGDGRKISAKKIAENDKYDMALVQLEGLGDAPATFTALQWCTDEECDAGSFVATVADKEAPVAVGIVTVAERSFRMRNAGGNGNRAYLGVQAQGQDGSLVLARVLPDTAASRAGLKNGDILATVNDKAVSTQQELVSVLGRFKPNETIELLIKRDEKEMKIKAKLGRNTSATSGVDRWGGGPFTDTDQKRFGYPNVLAHDTVIRPEYCGTPVVNTDGKVVGINISRALRVATYAVPAKEVLKFIQENKKTKTSK